MVGIKDIREAAEKISPFIHRTPLILSRSFSAMTGAEVFIKAENLQKTGSFKVRGAVNKISRVSDGKVIAASMGNHAQGVAFASSRLGKQARIVMPEGAPLVKQEATRGYGADVELRGSTFGEALEYALSQKDVAFIHAFNDDDVISGQGTVGIEIVEDLRDIDAVIVPVGGGGLVSGVAVAVKALSPGTQVIGVQARSAPSAYLSFTEKRICSSKPLPTLADGIAVGRVGEKTFEIIEKYVDGMFLVDEDEIAMTILLFLERKKLVVEGAGAVSLAALIKERERFSGRRVVIIASGGNIDFSLIDRIIHKGLAISGRIGIFEVTVDDLPGRLHTLTGIIAAARGNILNVAHDRLAPDLPVGKTRVIFTLETRGTKHLEQILADLAGQGFEVRRREQG